MERGKRGVRHSNRYGLERDRESHTRKSVDPDTCRDLNVVHRLIEEYEE